MGAATHGCGRRREIHKKQEPIAMSTLMSSAHARARVVLVLLSLFVAAGCTGPQPDVPSRQMPPPGSISVYTVADRLSLDVVANQEDHVVLRDSLNSVLFFGGDTGRAYANGQPISVGAPVVRVDGTYYVPEALVDKVRSVLRDVPADPPDVVVDPPVEPPRPPLTARSRGLLVVVDPGHGGRDPGARSVSGHSEKWINLSVGKKLAAELEERGYTVRLTRSRDKFIPLNSRAEIANRLGADLFVSIHADACGTPSVRGSSVYICRGASDRSGTAAVRLSRALKKAPLPHKGLRKADFRVLVRTRCPAVLVECGYLTNREDNALLLRRDIQNELVGVLADGIDAATRGW
jgi:N-acetylmuramoyl-L-alanine amidase